jgi:hypothetical protein
MEYTNKELVVAINDLKTNHHFQVFLQMLKDSNEQTAECVADPELFNGGGVNTSEHLIHTGIMRCYRDLLKKIDTPEDYFQVGLDTP